MSNFFNAIGVADMEKVHSAVIGWLFSTECEALDKKQKSELLCKLFGETEKEFNTIKAKVEIYNIDILIITDENEPNPSCWVIENKIKSSQHSNQLDKYVDIVNGEPVKIGRSSIQVNDYKSISDKHFCFLTLVNEKPQCSKVTWKNATYKDLASLLNNLQFQTHTDATILKEYRECIKDMTDILVDFLDNHQNYPHVFTDGSKKKTEKDYTVIKNENGKYIADNGLETIFQKCFLLKVIEQTTNFKSHSNKIKIKETHGTALWEYLCETINGTNLGVQFQNGTFKVQVLRVIDENLPQKDKKQLVKLFWDKWNNIFKTNPSLIPDWQGPNKSKEEKGPYFSFSISMKMGKKWWYSYPITKIAEYWDTMYDKCQSALKELKKHC